MIVDVPPDTPVTIPVEEPMVAMLVVLLLHEPPGVPSVSGVVRPEQTTAVPLIDPGAGLMVMALVALQPTALV